MLYMIILFAIIAIIDVFPLFRQKKWKPAIILSALFVLIFTLTAFYMGGADFIVPLEAAADFMERIGVSY